LLAIAGLAMPVAIAQNRSATPAEVNAALQVLDRWRGRWNVTITTTQPAAATAKSTATNSWVLGDRFLQGDSGAKSDGTRDLSMMTFDAVARAYPLWIFTSSGVVFYLPDGKWDEASRTMQWDSPINLTASYRYRCQFPDADTYRCHSLLKDWKGKVLLKLEAVGTRLR
jgi:hypothetical protein